MASFVTTTLYQLVFFINHAENGWSESWYLLDTSHAQALATAAELLEARGWMIAANHVIEYAELKSCEIPRDVCACIGDPIEPLAMWGPSANDSVGLLFRLQTGTGRKSNHLIRGVSDDEINDNKWTRHPLALPAGIAPKPANPNLATKAELWQYFLTLFRARTGHARPVEGIFPLQDEWEVTNWQELIYRHVSTGPYGSKYHRVSGEWWPWNKAPDFSFCGTVCGVQRTCRDTDTYAYVDGAKIVFRTYIAQPGATVFPHRHIFFGTYRDKDNHNTTAPGELKGAKKTLANPNGVWEWSSGLAAGAAPGIAWTGPASRFLGLDLCPYNSALDTPIEQRPACDMPVLNALTFQLDDLSVDIPDCFLIVADADTIGATPTGLHEVFIWAKGPTVRDTTGGAPLTDSRELRFRRLKVTQPAPNVAEIESEASQCPYIEAATLFTMPAYTRVGNVLTANQNGLFPSKVISYQAPTPGMKILVRYTRSFYDMGIYEMTDEGADDPGGRPWKLTLSALDSSLRPTDFFRVVGSAIQPYSVWAYWAAHTFMRIDKKQVVTLVQGISVAALPAYTREYLHTEFNPADNVDGGWPAVLTASSNGLLPDSIFDFVPGVLATNGIMLLYLRNVHLQNSTGGGLYTLEDCGAVDRPWRLCAVKDDYHANPFRGVIRVVGALSSSEQYYAVGDASDEVKLHPQDSLSPGQLAEVLAYV